ncbi:MAG: TIGR00159 family protein [Candidatus Melainabacteria bacterium RIFOXYA12_FULL_32_12]|nr:MAG: TIGR00159 family protein [Candidatus Melainabacteria bacterium RIFOXYA2_FULL_32_9]OGI24212.1 MAG: TIGR00159 family protein [Candidatus Melainabacteria bacterium RIFOXYA12_FULL_32_12]
MDFLMTMNPLDVFELIIIIFFIVVFGLAAYRWYRHIKGTPTERLLNGALLVLFALLISKVFNLQILGRLLEGIVSIIVFGLIVIFQPELRRLLGYLGQPGILSKNIFAFGTESEVKNTISELTETVKHLSKSHIGALIVIQNTTGFENYIEVGTKIDAKVSTELLLTIFHPNTPLHDGAVVVSGDRIVAAGVLLPLTEDPTLSWKFGTRHRAAIGMSEVSDAACLVVSEETGDISLAQGGLLTKFISAEDLKIELDFLYGFAEPGSEKAKERTRFAFPSFFSRKVL